MGAAVTYHLYFGSEALPTDASFFLSVFFGGGGGWLLRSIPNLIMFLSVNPSNELSTWILLACQGPPERMCALRQA